MAFEILVWSLLLLPTLLFVIILVTYNLSYVALWRQDKKSLNTTKFTCDGWQHMKWEKLNFSISRRTQLFLKMDDYFWRSHVSDLPLPFGVNDTVPMLVKVLSETLNYWMPSNIDNIECKTCVVVGNSFAIKNTSLGSIINQYDVVIRLNDAPVRGYEKDVGSKTTMRLFYPESASSNPALHNEEDTLMVLVPFKQHDLRWLKEVLRNDKRDRKGFWKLPPLIWQVDSTKVRVLDPNFMKGTATELLKLQLRPGKVKEGSYPTTGLLAVFVALNYCDVVHLAGFGYPAARRHRHPIHYFGTDTMSDMNNTPHDIGGESKALRWLENLGAIMYLHAHV